MWNTLLNCSSTLAKTSSLVALNLSPLGPDIFQELAYSSTQNPHLANETSRRKDGSTHRNSITPIEKPDNHVTRKLVYYEKDPLDTPGNDVHQDVHNRTNDYTKNPAKRRYVTSVYLFIKILVWGVAKSLSWAVTKYRVGVGWAVTKY